MKWMKKGSEIKKEKMPSKEKGGATATELASSLLYPKGQKKKKKKKKDGMGPEGKIEIKSPNINTD